jgi:hypothetical protein
MKTLATGLVQHLYIYWQVYENYVVLYLCFKNFFLDHFFDELVSNANFLNLDS